MMGMRLCQRDAAVVEAAHCFSFASSVEARATHAAHRIYATEHRHVRRRRQRHSRHRHYIQLSTSAYSVGCQFQKMSGKRWTEIAFKAQSEARRHSSSKGAAPPYQRRKTARELRSGARGALPTCSSRLLLELDCEVVLEIKICSVNKGYVSKSLSHPPPPLPSSTGTKLCVTKHDNFYSGANGNSRCGACLASDSPRPAEPHG